MAAAPASASPPAPTGAAAPPTPATEAAFVELLRRANAAIAADDPATAELVRQLMALGPEEPEALLVAAGQALHLGRLEEAARLADRLNELHPDDWTSLTIRGCVRSVEGRADAALADLDRALELTRDQGDEARLGALSARSRAARHAGRLRQALEDAEEMLRLAPGDLSGAAARALARIDAGRPDLADAALLAELAARDRFGRRPETLLARTLSACVVQDAAAARGHAAAINPECSQGRLARAAVASLVGDPVGEVRHLEAATRLDPGDVTTWATLAVAYARLGREHDEAALAAALRATDRAPDFPRAWHALASTHEIAGRWELALQALERCLLLDPSYPGVVPTHAALLLLAGDPRACQELIVKALELRPGAAHQLVGILALASVRRGAFAELEAALAQDPERRSALAAQAELEGMIAMDDPAAQVEAERAIEGGLAEGATPDLLRVRALLALRRGDAAAAERDARAALALAPTPATGEVRALLGQALLLRGQPEAARAEAEAELAILPRSTLARVLRGEASLALGDAAGALADAQRALERDPDLAAALDLQRRARQQR